MVERLRVPFLVLAILLSLALVLAEVGMPQYQEALAELFSQLPQRNSTDKNNQAIEDILTFFPPEQRGRLAELLNEADETRDQLNQPLKTFGFGLRDLWLVDGLVLFSLLLIGLGVLVPPAWQARIQGVLTLLYALFVIVTAIALIMKALAAAILMFSVLLAFPFGTIDYFIKWANFDRSGAAAILSLFFTLKLFIGGAVVLAHQRFIQNLGLVLVFIGSLIANLIVSFLHALVPGFLVSISDAVAGAAVGILSVILAVILLIGAVISIVAALRPW